jgi:regulation of enolase protein 1 (concanavalin A-like superfamily)
MSMKLLPLCLLLVIGTSCQSEQTAKNFKLNAIPQELNWYNTPLDWKSTGDTLTITGGKGSRLFVDPQGQSQADSAPIALFKPDETFLFSCKIKVDFNAVFDAGVLMIYADAKQWAKLCFEYTPQLKPMLVSVVNNEFSDDNNHELIQGNEIYARIAGLGNGAYAFHYSLDGKHWNMLRYFRLDPKHNFRIGFLSQSPRGELCKTTFSEIRYSTQKLADIRNGD